MQSGLHSSLVEAQLLISHEEADANLAPSSPAYKIIKPRVVPFISYPYEWSFSQLKHAALTTLAIQRQAMDYGMSLKDCSGFNVQFLDGKPIFIDTLSFQRYVEGEPWIAYRQFCQHFLAPLALMSHTDIRLSSLLRVQLDGIPVDLASRLLPYRTRLKPSMLLHVHLHAAGQKKFAVKSTKPRRHRVSRAALAGLLSSLESAINGLHWKAHGTVWGDYYNATNYSDTAMAEKRRVVAEYLDRVRPHTVWDFGANTGTFSRIATAKGIRTAAFDFDMACVERNYLDSSRDGDKHMLPLVMDLANPSSGIGWHHRERKSLLERGPADAVLCLALIHHLAISCNVPLTSIAEFMASVCGSLIIEFVPKEDSNAQRLLTVREDVFKDYSRENFEHAFQKYFTLSSRREVPATARALYLFQRR
jgi:ribosomal protein L11 methylase PrmA